VRRNLSLSQLGDLLDRPLVAVLATYRRDATVLLSPVWHEWRAGGFHVVTSRADVKAGHLRRDPRASIAVYEHGPPYRGVEVRGRATLGGAGVDEVVRRLAIRYLGEAAGSAYAERAADDVLIRLEPGDLRAWDFADEFPP
jgi:PPOX class probable F420-dependent enzyme